MQINERVQFCLAKAASKTRPNQIPNALLLVAEARALVAELSGDRTHRLLDIAKTYQILVQQDLSLALLDDALAEMKRVESALQDDRFGTVENQIAESRAEVFCEAGALGLKLGQTERGWGLLEASLAHALQADADLDAQYTQLCEIAYTYAEAGRQDEAIAIAQKTDAYHAASSFFIQVGWHDLRTGNHTELLNIITASAWTGFQIWVAQSIVECCFDDSFVRDYPAIASPNYPLQVLEDLEDLETQISLLIALGREYFRTGQDEEALQSLEKADEKIEAIASAQKRSALRHCVDDAIAWPKSNSLHGLRK